MRPRAGLVAPWNWKFMMHSQQLSTRGDLADLNRTIHADLSVLRADLANFKLEIMKWTVGTMFASVALFATIVKVWQ